MTIQKLKLESMMHYMNDARVVDDKLEEEIHHEIDFSC
jgi:hypothetical protein